MEVQDHNTENNGRILLSLLLTFIFLLGLAAFVLCIAAEFQKAQGKDLKWNGESCFLPETRAFVLGTAALVCVSIAQIIGNVVICKGLWKTKDKTGIRSSDVKTTPFCVFLMLFSWVNFAVAVTLISVAASMNKEQRYGEGWLKRECYLVKKGVFAASGILSITTLVAILGATASKRNFILTSHNHNVFAKKYWA